MAIDRRAEAYARQFAPLFVSRYIDAVSGGQATVVPTAIRPSLEAYVSSGRDISGVDVNAWVYQMLYEHRVRTGGDAQLPSMPESQGAKVAKVAGTAALGIGGALLEEAFKLSRRGLFR